MAQPPKARPPVPPRLSQQPLAQPHLAQPSTAQPPTAQPSTAQSPLSRPGAERQGIERQLSVLYGESLFGPWPELGSTLAHRGRLRTRRVWLWRLVAIVVTVALLFGVRELLRPGLVRKSDEDRTHYAQQLGMFLEEGSLHKAAKLADVVRGQAQGLAPGDADLDLLVRAEASLYRYLDADPERVARIVPYLKNDAQGSPALRLAQLTLLSHAEQAEHLAELEGLGQELSRDPEVYYLLATARERRGDLDAARQAWTRSEDLGPAWLPHRFEQALFEKHHDNASAAARIAEEMRVVEPDSSWSEAAARLFPPPTEPSPAGDSGGTKLDPARKRAVVSASAQLPEGMNAPDGAAAESQPPPTPQVQVYRTALILALDQAKRGETATAQRTLADAIGAVHGGKPFVIDAFDDLVEGGALELARTLTRLPAWPADTPIGAAKNAQLSKALEAE